MFRNENDLKKLIDRLEIDMQSSPTHREKLRRQMLSAFNETRRSQQAGSPSRAVWQNIAAAVLHSRMTQLAAAAVIIIAAVIGLNQLIGPIGVATLAFADVVEPFLNARTATFNVTTEVQGGPTQSFEGMYMEPGLMRQTAEEAIVITNLPAAKIVSQIPSQNMAVVHNIVNMPEEPGELNLFMEIRRRVADAKDSEDESVEFLGEREIDGRNAVGYHVEKAGVGITIWADAETKMPLRMENVIGPVTNTLTDFAFDVDLDETLFSQEIPEGYTVHNLVMDASEPTEEDLIEMFRLWTEQMDGRFPSSVEMSATMEFVQYQKKIMIREGKEPSEKEMMEKIMGMQQVIMNMSRGFTFVQQLPSESEWHYAGKDVRLGDADKAIFWYRPKASPACRVVYADLTVKEVEPDNLPSLQQDTVIDEEKGPAEPNLSIIGTGGAEDTPFEFKAKGVLSGLITDANTGEPVVGARIRIRKWRHYRTATDENGFYSFDKVDEDGDYIVRVHSPEHMWFGNWKDEPVVELRSGSNRVKHLAVEPGCLTDVNVVDEQGKPIDGAQLYVSWTGQKYGRETGRDRRPVPTNDDGEATVGAFEPSNVPYLITAVHEDYAPGKFLAKLTDPQVIEYAEIVMQRGAQVQGYAHYADGVPAEGLSVLAKPDWWNITSSNPMAPIDPNGYFTLEHIAAGSYTVYVYTPNPTGGGGTSRPVITTQLPLDGAMLVVEAPGESPTGSASISGTIVYVGSQEPRDVRVSVYSPIGDSVSARVDGDTFTIDSLKAGLYRLSFSGDNIEGKVIPNVRAPSNDLEIELRCVREPRLRGSVVRADTNEPVPQFKLRVMKLKTFRHTGRPERRDWRSFSGPTGRFDLEVGARGAYQVQVVADGLAPAWSSEINTGEDEPVIVKLDRGGSIKGRVVNEAYEPITDAKVVPLSLACGPEPSAMHLFFTETGAVKTKAGEFILQNLPQGLESIRVTHPDYCFAVVENIEIQPGRTTNVKVVIGKGAAVEGRVYDQEGRPQANELLYFQDAPTYRYDRKLGRFASVVTDSNGLYRAEKLPERLCYVSRAKWDRMGVIRATVMPVKGKVTRLDFGGRDRVITGRMLLDNEALPETKMLLGDPFDPHAPAFIYHTTTDASGDYSFSGVPAGWYGLYYKLLQDPRYPGTRWAKAATFFMTAEDIDLGAINIQTTTANVIVNFDEWNELFEGHELYLQKGRQFWGTRFGTVVKPESPSGPYTITGVPNGTYSLAVKRADNVILMEPVTIDANETGTTLTMNIPKCAASLTGMLQSHPQVFVRLRRDDGRVIAVISGGGDGTYWIQDVPAGRYTIAGIYEGDSAPLATVTLTEDRTTYLDIDPWPLAQLIKAALHTQIVDSGGAPIDAARVWLESDGTRIEPCRITEEGQFFVCEPGRYTLRVSCPGYSPVEKSVDLRMKDLFGTGFSEGTMVITLRD